MRSAELARARLSRAKIQNNSCGRRPRRSRRSRLLQALKIINKKMAAVTPVLRRPLKVGETLNRFPFDRASLKHQPQKQPPPFQPDNKTRSALNQMLDRRPRSTRRLRHWLRAHDAPSKRPRLYAARKALFREIRKAA